MKSYLKYFWAKNIEVKQDLLQAATRHVEQLEAEGETNINGALLQALKIVSQTQVYFPF